MLRDVTEEAPKFTPAWSKLLLAELDAFSLMFNAGNLPKQEMLIHRRHIAAAKEIDPQLPAAALAEAMLLPPRDFLGRSKMIEQAAAISPDDPNVAQFLAGALTATGRQREGVEAAARAFRLDPLSPNSHANYITLLIYSGAFDAAERELAKAEELWPGTANLRDVQYRYHLRYGDVQRARDLMKEKAEGRSDAFRLYLDAREDPRPAKIQAMVDYVRARLQNIKNKALE